MVVCPCSLQQAAPAIQNIIMTFYHIMTTQPHAENHANVQWFNSNFPGQSRRLVACPLNLEGGQVQNNIIH